MHIAPTYSNILQGWKIHGENIYITNNVWSYQIESFIGTLCTYLEITEKFKLIEYEEKEYCWGSEMSFLCETFGITKDDPNNARDV